MENSNFSSDYYTNILFDYIFIGLGASNSLILLSLLKKSYHLGKKIAVLEASEKNSNDKTYCFWASPQDDIVKDLGLIISHKYENIEVNQSKTQNIESQPYYYISSLDLYRHTSKTIAKESIPVIRVPVESLHEKDEIYLIEAGGTNFKARFVFDSRPPAIKKLKQNEIYLNQSFHGFSIKCENEVFDKNTFEMMDFDVDQGDFTQFIYTLPFSKNESLVELTRFGSEKLEKEYAYKILDEVIKRKFGNYEIIDYESGNIPMTNLVNPPSIFKGVLNTGVSANLIKPSTGYGFKNMFRFAEKLTSKIGKGDFDNFNRFSIKLNRRFRFYDSLLLIILLKWPFQGKKIFTQLFNSQNVFTLFSFLDEKTSLKNEVKIFLNLPILPFLRALVIYLKEENLLRYFIAFVSILVFAAVDYFSTEAALNFSYGIIILGLISIGIPHGALDHLLHPNSYNSLLKFILSYLLIVFIYFIFWQFYPLLSLTIFIIYSSFHFGESELVELGVKIKTVSYYVNAFSLGIAILTFILFTHTTEALSIVSAMSGFEFSELVNKQIASYSSSISMVAFLFIGILALVKRKIALVWLLFLLLLGIIVPLTFAFILYFVFQHSFNAWSHLKNGLDVNSISLYKKALPFTIGAMLVLIILAIINFNELLDVHNVMPFFYVFLACISLPHIILMHFFYKKNQ